VPDEFFDLDKDLLAQMREDFLAESQEILDRLGLLLARLERGSNAELINTIFREVHTLKGTAGFVSLISIQKLAHKMEDVFGEVRSEKLAVTPRLVDEAFQGLDRLIALRAEVTKGNFEEGDVDDQIKQLDDLLHGRQNSPTSKANTVNLDGSETSATATEANQATAAASSGETTLRVETETLDALLDLAGELITARNALSVTAERLDDDALSENALAISRLTRQIQTAVSSVRLVPIERLLNRFTPIVRSVARDQGKQVRYVIEGGDTPIDRTVSEQISDPLVHMIRNAIDHGLEAPEVRRAAGKAEEGTLRIAAERRGDDVVLRVSDDGAGIDPARLREAAVKRGLYTEAEAKALSDDEATRLIFAPGFSTAAAITDLSGRGVGMDVVLQNVRRLRGRIDIETVLRRGTTFVITLPLTLAILQVLLVRSGQHVYAIPLHSVRETLRIAPGEIKQLQHKAITYVRETALPVHHLANWFEPGSQTEKATKIQAAFVIRLTRGDEVVTVDELVGKQQMVVKHLSPYLGHVAGVEGAAILPDGQVGLILDMEQLLSEA